MNKTIDVNQLQRSNPLIWAGQGSIQISPDQKNIFLGGGVATKTIISQAVPFDLIGFVLTAEQLRRECNSNVHMLIADQHAWLANNLDKSDARSAANNLLSTTQRIINSFELDNWHLHLASELFPNAISQAYESLEIRDIDHFATHFNCGVKIGWTFSPNEKGLTDESHFDTLHNMSTVLIKPGLTLDHLKPHESPYICTNPTTRIIISDDENIIAKLTNDSHISNTVSNHLRSICLLFTKMVHTFLPKTPFHEKVTQIIQSINQQQ